MYENIKFEELLALGKRQLEERGFSYDYTHRTYTVWHRMYLFAISRGIDTYSAELPVLFLKEYYSIDIGSKASEVKLSNDYYIRMLRAIEMLTDFMQFGYIQKLPKGKYSSKTVWPDGFQIPCQSFIDHVASLGRSQQICRKHQLILERFVTYLSSQGVHKPDEITVENIFSYFQTLVSKSKMTLYEIRSYLKRALLYFSENGWCSPQLAECLPRIYYYKDTYLLKVWSEEEIEKILQSVSRFDPLGKRDYAIISIAVNYGLRTGDIARLKIGDFNWGANTLTITTQKTGEPLTLPILEEVGKAVIDYWKNGRPKSSSDKLFVKHKLPYDEVTNQILYAIFNKYLRASGVSYSNNEHHGLHSLRHSLASRLLENGVPTKVISDILSHVNEDTAKAYIRIDINQLRECAMEVPQIGE